MPAEIALDDLTATKAVVMQHGYLTLIDECDWPAVRELRLYRGPNGYAYFSRWKMGRRGPQTLHRHLLDPPAGTHVDHINGIKLDNRRSNLRVVSPSANQFNRFELNANNASGARGVSYMPHLSRLNPWTAQIGLNGRTKHLGLFPTKEAAIAARLQAEAEHPEIRTLSK